MIEIIKDWNKKQLKCHFCGSEKSVKYQVNIIDSAIDRCESENVYCCNRCVLSFIR